MKKYCKTEVRERALLRGSFVKACVLVLSAGTSV